MFCICLSAVICTLVICLTVEGVVINILTARIEREKLKKNNSDQ